MATIQKRGGSYRIKVSCGYSADGKQIVKSMSWKPAAGMTQRQIEKELKRVSVEFETKVYSGEYVESKKIKLSDFCDQYLEISEQTLAPTTKAFYKNVIEQIIKPSLGHMMLDAIKPIHIQKFIGSLCGDNIRSDGRGDKLKPATVKRYLTVLKSIMSKAYKLELIEKNPTDSSKLDIPVVEEPEVEIFTPEEAAHMLKCLEDEPLMFQVLIHLAITTGCRRGELVALKWNCVDFFKNEITVKQSNYKLKGEEIKSKSPKTQKSHRTISIPPYLTELLKLYRRYQASESLRLGEQWHEEGWIFTQRNGEPMNPQTPTRQFDKFLKRHNIPHRKFHSLRHTSATILLLEGTNIKSVAGRLGHTQLSTTNRYVHALREADKAAAQIFEEIVVGAEDSDTKNMA